MRAVTLLLLALLVTGAQSQEKADPKTPEVIDLDEAIKQFGETVPQATKDTIGVLKDEGGPVARLYCAGAVRRHYVTGGIAASLAFVALLGAVVGLVGAIRTEDGSETSAAWFAFSGVMLGFFFTACAVAICHIGNAEFYGLQDTINAAAALIHG